MESRQTTTTIRTVLVGLVASLLAVAAAPAWAAKNVIILIADGAGFNTWQATSMYEGKLGQQVFDGKEWVKLAVCTYPLTQTTKPKGLGVQKPDLVYDPVKAWAAEPVIEQVPITEDKTASPSQKKDEKKEEDEEEEKEKENGDKKDNGKSNANGKGEEDVAKEKGDGTKKDDGKGKADDEDAPKKKVPTKPVRSFAGYVWLKKTYTDSAAAATAMAAGVKTYNNGINWTDLNKPLSGQTLPELAKAAGKSCGVITSVSLSHATPAAFGGAHNVTRNNYRAIANEMLDAPYLDVIMGAGHPDFTDDGLPRKKAAPAKAAPSAAATAAPTATAATATTKSKSASSTASKAYQYVGGQATWAKLKAGTHPGGWKLVETKGEFEALTRGVTPTRVLGVAQVATTLQQKRGKATEKQVLGCPLNANVPSLATMTQAAIHCLEKNSHGFYLMVEGGAVDWANHSRHAPRMIEEQMSFYRALDAVVEWVESRSSWDETLVIITADHETGLMWGPGSDVNPFAPLLNRGPKTLPGLKYNSGSHSSSLVPLFARGPGAERFSSMVRGTDPTAAAAWGISGQYADNTSIYNVAKAELADAAGPSPRRERAPAQSAPAASAP